MTERSRFFNSYGADTRAYNAAELAQVFSRFLRNGVIRDIGGNLAVSAGAGVSVSVADGEAIINGYWYENDAAKTVDLAAPDPANPRIDRIVLRLDLSSNVRLITAEAKTGVPAASPVAPALQQDGTIWEESLAQVRVPAGSGVPLQITDERAWAGINPVELLDMVVRSVAPANPASGNMRLYVKDGLLYLRNAAGQEVALVDVSTAQTLANKTLTAPTMSTPAVTTAIKMTQISTPAAPGAGLSFVYSKSDGRLYIRSGTGSEATVGELWLPADGPVQSSTTPNGSVTQFNIGAGVASSKVRVFVNGIMRRPTTDYSFSPGNSYVTFAWAPVSGDDVRMEYVPA